MTLETTINGQLFTMHFSGALFWNEKNTLLIADVHLGKVTHFRKNGFAIPNDALYKNFEKLIEVVDFSKLQPFFSWRFISQYQKQRMGFICRMV